MPQGPQQQIGQAQRQVLAQSARQLLQLVVAPADEFADRIEREAAENPFLAVSPAGPVTAEPQVAEGSVSLFAHVLAEMPLLLRRSADLPIAARLTEGLDERGFLADSLASIAAERKVPLERVEAVLRQMQQIEPAGLFARTVTECLALQLRAQGLLDRAAVSLLGNLAELGASGPEAFARRHGIDPIHLARLVRAIALMPRCPAAIFAGTAPTALPDLRFERLRGEWAVSLIRQSASRLSLRHAAFADALTQATDAQDRSALRRKWREACRLHQAAGVRDDTLLALGQSLLELQRAGLDSQLARLAPLTRRQIALRLSVHESTVGRLVGQRFALVEGRLVPLSRFFARPLASGDSPGITRSVVLEALRHLIATHPEAAGLSDLALTRKLAGSGIKVSRRRLGKYREMLGIPSSRRRRAAG